MVDKLNILLVDDKKENLFALEKLLEDLNVNILQTTSGFEALKIVLEQEVATILLDIQMPGIDGYEVARLLKKNSRTVRIPIIFVTAINQEPEQVLLGYETGAADYLFKPLNPAITRAKVKSFIQLYQQQKELEEKNKELENLTLLIKNAVDLMCILDLNFQIHSPNPAWIKTLGYTMNEIENCSYSKFIDAKQNQLASIFKRAEHKRHLLNHEVEMISAKGRRIWFSWCFVFQNGKWYGNGRNISDKKNAEAVIRKANDELEITVKRRTKELEMANAQLKKTNANLDNFVYTASHDLKLPIANLEGLQQSLKEELSGSEEKNEEIEVLNDMVGNCIIQLKDTIDDLIEIIKRPQDKDTEDALRQGDCKSILDEIKLSIQELIHSTEASIEVNFIDCSIDIPKANFRSILYNLLTNAIKYHSPERKPIIKVSLKEKNDFNILEVLDNGIGISDEDLKKLFQKFERLNQDKEVEGTGIGLFIVKNTIEKSGGKIEVESKEGIGSSFKVFFKKKLYT